MNEPGMPLSRAIGAAGRRTAALSADELKHSLYRIRVREIWHFVRAQPWSFSFVCFYLFIEYVRPQQIYPALGHVRWGLIALVGCLLLRLLEGRRIVLWGPGAILLLVYSGIVMLSAVTAYVPSVTIDALPDYLTWVLVFVLITNIADDERRFLVFMLSFLLYSFKMSWHATRSWALDGFAFRSWGASGPSGWFGNSGEFGVQMVVFLSLAIYFVMALRPYWPKWKVAFFLSFPATAAVAIVASSSRGALIGGLAVIAWLLLKSAFRLRTLVLTVAIAGLGWFLIPPEQFARLDAMGTDQTSLVRLEYIKAGQEIMAEYPMFGIGFKNWVQYYRSNFVNPYIVGGEVPHNILVEAGAELGYPGLLTFLAMVGATFYVNFRTRRIVRARGEQGRFLSSMAHGLDGALVGFFICGQFVTILYYPFFWINLAMTVALNRAAHRAVREPNELPVQGTLRAYDLRRGSAGGQRGGAVAAAL